MRNRIHLRCLDNPVENKFLFFHCISNCNDLNLFSWPHLIPIYLNSIALFGVINTKCCAICRCVTFKLLFEANKSFAIISFVRITLASAIADLNRTNAISIFTLILTRFTFEISTRLRLVRIISAVILFDRKGIFHLLTSNKKKTESFTCSSHSIYLSVTNPIEGNAFFDGSTLKFSRCTVCDASTIVGM